MMEGNSRRKAKLTIINNQCVNEDVCIELLSTGSSNTDDADDLAKMRKKLLQNMFQSIPSGDSDPVPPNKPQTPRKRNKSTDKSKDASQTVDINANTPKKLNARRNTTADEDQPKSLEVEHIQISPKRRLYRTRSRSSSEASNADIAAVTVDPLLITHDDLANVQHETIVGQYEAIPYLKTNRKSIQKKNIVQQLNEISDNSASDCSSSPILDQFKIQPKVILHDVLKSPTKPTGTSVTESGVRKSNRPKRLSIKALEAIKSPTKKTWRKLKQIDSDSSSDEINEDIEKPTELFESNGIDGKEIFGFRTPKKRTALLQTAKAVANSPMSILRKDTEKLTLTPKTPRSSKKLEFPKTPAAVRSKYSKNIAKVVQEIEDDEFSDFSASESEFEPTDTQSSSSDQSSGEENVNSDDSIPAQSAVIRKIGPKTPKTRTRNRKEITYSLKSDDYFTTHSSKLYTSDNTLDKLKNPRLTQDKINDILRNVEINKAHNRQVSKLLLDYQDNFEKWLFLLCEGNFSILLYGLGSKKSLFQQFNQYLCGRKWPAIFINGYFPSLLIKDVLDAITNDLLQLANVSVNPIEAVDDIREYFDNNTEVRLFLLVNNIDGEMLRNCKAQNILSKLAAIPRIHLVASIDDINAPLIWDHRKLNRFNFTWWDVTTFLPYSEETSFEGSLLVQRSGTLTLSALKNIFQSLTTNARGIFTIIIKHHMENKKDVHYQGIMFKDLYWACREAFLVSSDTALRAQLTEFLDHKLIKTKRSLDGAELLHIPIENSLLQHFLTDED